jgi:6-phosphogluconolactonase
MGRLLFIANYGTGSIAAYPINDDGSLAPASIVIQHSGSSIGGERQAGPHAHCALVSPRDDFLYAADLGIDKIKTYRINYKTMDLEPLPDSDGSAKPGSGPRHVAISEDQKYVYVLEEMGSQIEVFVINPDNGALSKKQEITTLPEDYENTNFCADIHIDPLGKYLYASNRGHNSLAIYSIDQDSGELTFIEHQAVMGNWPRNFMIEPEGDYLFVANRRSNNIVIFKRNPGTGKLIYKGEETDIPEPVCIKYLRIY